MANLSVSNTFVGFTTILSSDMNTNFSDIVSYINNRNSASASWDQLSVSGNATVAGTFNPAGGFLDGTVAAPSIAFASDSATGMYRISSGSVGFSTAGSTALSYSGTDVTLRASNVGVLQAKADGIRSLNSIQLLMHDGSFSLPSHSFDTEDSTGMYLIGAGNLGFAVAGTKFVDAQTSRGFSIKGTDGNTNALSGFVGEYIESIVSSAGNIAASGTFGNITSITLSAGDWDITGIAVWSFTGSTSAGEFSNAISIYSGNTTTDHVNSSNYVQLSIFNANALTSAVIPSYRILCTGSTVVYLKAKGTYSGSVPQVAGTIRARRVR